MLVDGHHSDAKAYLRLHPFDRVKLVSNPTGSREGRVRVLSECLANLKPDVVLGVNVVDIYEAVARVRGEGDSPKVAMALHALQSSYYQDMRRLTDVIDGAVATNRLGAAAAVELGGLSASRVFYAQCGVPAPACVAESSSSGTLELRYAGRFEAGEKRVLDLVEILHALGRRGVDYQLKLAGSGSSEGILREALREFGPRVDFAGVLNESELRNDFFTPGSIALVMSPSETGPIVAWEAMASGAALVTSRFVGIGLEGGLRSGENCLVFEVGDIEQAAAHIARLADRELRRTLASAGADLVARCYSRDVSVLAWDRALRDIRNLPRLSAAQTRAHAPAAGRLDRLLGPGLGEAVRRLLRIEFRHDGPGGEWPHSYGTDNDGDFAAALAHLDESGKSSRMDQ